MIDALETAARDNEEILVSIQAYGGNNADMVERDIRGIRGAIKFLNELPDALCELWNRGWAIGQADHAAKLGRTYSEPTRDAAVNKILEIKL